MFKLFAIYKVKIYLFLLKYICVNDILFLHINKIDRKDQI